MYEKTSHSIVSFITGNFLVAVEEFSSCSILCSKRSISNACLSVTMKSLRVAGAKNMNRRNAYASIQCQLIRSGLTSLMELER